MKTIKIEIPAQVIEAEINPNTSWIENAIYNKEDDLEKICNDNDFFVLHIASLIKAKFLEPPKQTFTREEIIEPIVQKLKNSYQGVPFCEMRKMNIVKLAESLGIDFATEIKPLIE